MPYYHWRGITLQGQISRGTAFARSVSELDTHLLKRDIALLSSKQSRKKRLQSTISLQHKIDFFRQISQLLSAGILLPHALIIVTQQVAHPQFQEYVHSVAEQVNKGASLSRCLEQYPAIFDQLMIQMTYIGQEAGALAQTLELLADHLETVQQFHVQVRSAALLPCITFLFFVLIVLVIMIGIIPQFQTLFTAFNHELPSLTQSMIAISTFLRSRYMILSVAAGGFVIILLQRYIKTEQGRMHYDKFLVKMPIIGMIVRNSSLLFLMRSLAVLIESRFPLPAALSLSIKTVPNSRIKQQLYYLVHEVDSGTSLSDALIQHPQQIFSPDIIAMIHVGQESGMIVAMLKRVSIIYQERIKRSLKIVTTIIQPL